MTDSFLVRPDEKTVKKISLLRVVLVEELLCGLTENDILLTAFLDERLGVLVQVLHDLRKGLGVHDLQDLLNER